MGFGVLLKYKSHEEDASGYQYGFIYTKVINILTGETEQFGPTNFRYKDAEGIPPPAAGGFNSLADSSSGASDEGSDGETVSGDSRISGTGVPYSAHAVAHGGWTQSPGDDQGTPNAIGGAALMAQSFPADTPGSAYAILALKSGAGSNDKGYADPGQFIDIAGNKPWYDGFGTTLSTGLDQSADGGKSALDSIARKPTTSAIIEWAKEREERKNKRPYKYTDFVFCKHFQKIPNNYLVTLRRFATPVFDNLEFPGENGGGDKDPNLYYSPFAQALTYIGEDTGNALKDMLKYNAKIPYKENESKIHEVSQTAPGAEQGPAPGLAKVLGILGGGADASSIRNAGNTPLDPYKNGPYMNKVYGPLNIIKKVKARKQGLEFTQEFSLKFHYVARPIGGANTKAVMLDIMTNMLILCYAEGGFWGGGHRFTGGKPAYPFLGGKAGMDAMYSGDVGGFLDALTQQLGDAASTIGDIFNSILSDPVEGLKELAGDGAKLGMAAMISGKKKQMAQLPALLTGNPVGEWHMTIGNPFNPIMEVGNLVCDGVDFEFSEELGPDDFPLEMLATVKLSHGMPRDSAAIQSMFNRGGGKIYHLPDQYQFPGTIGGKENAGDSANSTGGKANNSNDPNSTNSTNSTDAGSTNSTQNKSALQEVSAAEVDSWLNTAWRAPSSVLEAAKAGYGYNASDD
jgi:hypothetical protein